MIAHLNHLRLVYTVNADADEVGFGQLIWAVDSARSVFPENTTTPPHGER